MAVALESMKKTIITGLVLLLMIVVGEASFFLGLQRQKDIILPSCTPEKECEAKDLTIVKNERTIAYFLGYMENYLKDKENTYKEPSFVLEHEGIVQELVAKDKKVSFKVTDSTKNDTPYSYKDIPYSRFNIFTVTSTIIKQTSIEVLKNGERVRVKNIRKLTPDQIDNMDITIEIYILE